MEVDKIEIDELGNMSRTPVTVDPGIRAIRASIHPSPLVVVLVIVLLGLLIYILTGWYRMAAVCSGVWVIPESPEVRLKFSIDYGQPVVFLYDGQEMVAKFTVVQGDMGFGSWFGSGVGAPSGAFGLQCIFASRGDSVVSKLRESRISFNTQTELLFTSELLAAKFVRIDS